MAILAQPFKKKRGGKQPISSLPQPSSHLTSLSELSGSGSKVVHTLMETWILHIWKWGTEEGTAML